MKSILIRKARIIDSSSPHHLKVRDILIEKGTITDIKSRITAPRGAQIVSSRELSVSQGWIDIGCFNGEPGHEHREDLLTLKNAAAVGGYVGIAPFPTTHPAIDSKGLVEFLQSKNGEHSVQVYPVANLTKGKNGTEMSELMDLRKAGAVAFSDGNTSTTLPSQTRRSMEYLKAFKGRAIISLLTEKSLGSGQVNEGPISIKMGLEGIPDYIEQVSLDALIRQIQYTGGRVLIHNLSQGSAADQVARLASKYQVNSSVAVMNLAHNEKSVTSWDQNYKVFPPLRSEQERKKLCRSVQKGNIDIITSNHVPHSQEDKDEPFGLSQFGASTLETVYASLVTFAKEINQERIIECLSAGPRRSLELSESPIIEGEKACLTLFDASLEWEVNSAHLRSKSKNNPYLGQRLNGRILGTINHNQFMQNEIQ